MHTENAIGGAPSNIHTNVHTKAHAHRRNCGAPPYWCAGCMCVCVFCGAQKQVVRGLHRGGGWHQPFRPFRTNFHCCPTVVTPPPGSALELRKWAFSLPVCCCWWCPSNRLGVTSVFVCGSRSLSPQLRQLISSDHALSPLCGPTTKPPSLSAYHCPAITHCGLHTMTHVFARLSPR